MKPEFLRLRPFADSASNSLISEINRLSESIPHTLRPNFSLCARAVGAVYPALVPTIRTHKECYVRLAREGFAEPRSRTELTSRLLTEVGADLLNSERVRAGLRHGVMHEQIRIALRELDPDVDVDVTARDWSLLADVMIEVAVLEARAHCERRFGPIRSQGGARNGFCVLGLGKLGGSELNAGSDVDIMFVYESDEGWVGNRGPDDPEASRPFDVFTKMAQRIVSTLEERDEHGFCARVDLRLRPEGSNGPLVNSIASLGSYYETFGRTWERAMLLRARPIAGDFHVGVRALGELLPFIFRRAVTPGIAADLNQMLERSRIEISLSNDRDLKRSEGGIREAEFFVQALQLIWGGHDEGVRATNTLDGLHRLQMRGYVNDREARHIRDGYLLLRRVEHRIQLSTGLQTHSLPTGDALGELARWLGYLSGVDLESAIARAKHRISQRFRSLMPSDMLDIPKEVGQILRWIETPPDADRDEITIEGMSPDFVEALDSLTRNPTSLLGALTREHHPLFVRTFIEALINAADRDLAAAMMLQFSHSLPTPSMETYIRGFEDDPRSVKRFVGLCGASRYLATSLIGHPSLADTLIFSKRDTEFDPNQARGLIDNELAQLSDPDRKDPEAFIGALRRAKSVIELDVGLRDLAEEIELRTVSQVFSSMADAILWKTTEFVGDEITKRFNLPKAFGGLAVLSLGKLGGQEIGYGSDLDVIFIYDPNHLVSAGVDPLDLPVIYSNAASRILRLISVAHADGKGYELDTRLRPSGEQGMLVVSLEAFRDYHLGASPGAHAADWERQALVRLRHSAGDFDVAKHVLAIANEAAYQLPPPNPHELVRLRLRMEREIAREKPGRFDVKTGHGGLIDVEFCVQFLQMKHGSHPEVRRNETMLALTELRRLGAMSDSNAVVFREGYRFLRKLEQRMRVVHGGRTGLLEDGALGLTQIARSMSFRDGPSGNASSQLLARYRSTTKSIRAAFYDALEVTPPADT